MFVVCIRPAGAERDRIGSAVALQFVIDTKID